MNYFLVASLSLISLTFTSHGTPSQQTKDQLTAVQTSIDSLINQSNLSADTTAELLTVTNAFIALAENSCEQELLDLQGATHISCLFEGSSTAFNQNITTTNQQLLSALTCSTRSNIIQKLILASYNNLFKDSFYTNPYVESIGYIANEWLCNALLNTSITNATKSIIGTNASLQMVVSRLISGVIATYAWYMQKKLAQKYTKNML